VGRLGTFSGLVGVLIVAASALFGAIVTVVMKRDPGTLLGVFVVAGTVLGCLAVRARSTRLLIPAPTLSYVPASILAGAINDRAFDTDHTADALHAGAWIANGFVMMVLATIVALVFTGLRLYLAWHYRVPAQTARYPRPVPVGDDWPSGRSPADQTQTMPVGQNTDATGRDQTRPIGVANGTGPYRPQETGPYRSQETGPYRSQGSGPQQAPETGPYRSQGSGPQQAQDTGPYRPQRALPRPPRPQGSGPYQAQDKDSGPYQAQDGGPYRPQGSGPYQAQDPYGSGPYPEPADLAGRIRSL
jgi:hypothetical protein